jgi:hypothetical protein
LTYVVSRIVALIDYDWLDRAVSQHQYKNRLRPAVCLAGCSSGPYNQKSDNQKAKRQVAIVEIVALVVLGLVALTATSKMLS